FNLAAEINYLDLQALNIVEDSIQLRSIVAFDFIGNNVDNFQGKAALYDFSMENNGRAFAIDSVLMNSYIDTLLKVREINLDSDYLSARMNGYFNILEIKDAALRFFEQHYPKYADKLNLQYDRYVLDTLVTDLGMEIVQVPRTLDKQDFTLSITGKENSKIPDLFNSPITEISTFNATAYLDSESNNFSFGARIPQIVLGKVETRDLWVAVNTTEAFTDVQAGTSETVINDSIYLPALDYEGVLKNDTVNFKLNATDLTEFITNLNLVGQFFPTKDYFQLSIKPSKFLIYDKEWNVLGDNYIRFNAEYIRTRNFKISHGSETVALNSVGKRGLDLTIGRLSLNPLNELIGNPKLNIQGFLSADIGVENIFKNEDFRVNGVVDSVQVNGNDWGQLLIHAETKSLKAPLRTRIKLKQGQGEVFLDGMYISPMAAKVSRQYNAHYLDFRVTGTNYPVGFAEYFIPQISNTTGTFDADLRLFGYPEKPNIQGLVEIPELSTKIDYLQTKYFIRNFTSRVNNNLFNFTGNKVQDINGRTASIIGGITHDHLRDFQMDVQVQTDVDSDDFLLLNTKKRDNKQFYGQAFGSAFLDFKGPFNQIDLILSATNSENTNITIPLSGTGSTQEVTFIEFVQRDTSSENKGINPGSVRFRGINIDMDLNVNQAAEIRLVFDEQAGDIIQGNGDGNIKIRMTRTGEFSMYGGYTVESGEYLFTYQNFINKPFAVKKGGTVRWDGDPYDADINVDAFYLGINVPVYTFIEEYLVGQESSQTVAAARTPTEVQLTMHLEGSLLSPEITFDMEFPNLDPSLRAFVESKLATIRQDDNALNRQVFGLIVLGNFLPSGEGPQSAAQLVTGINTLSELLSNQLSIYLTDLLSEVVNDVGFISSIDFDINYRLYQIESSTGGIDNNNLNTTASQVQLGLKNRFLDDRLIVNIGGNFDFANNSAFVNDAGQGAYIAGDFVIEYLITRDGRFRIRGYNRTESGFENIEGSQRNRTGVGISYSTQFDNFGEFINSFFGRFKKKNKNNNNNPPLSNY
ncbi:MAG: translocation/assembly module TamB domain-containing protein, partial [Bacteroidota bacterium]